MNKIIDSIKELKSTKNIVIMGLLVAIYVVIGFSSVYIMTTIRVSFTFIPLSLAGAMFGPFCGAVIGTIGDLLGYVTSQSAGGAFNPGFTVNAMLTGFIYGMLFYKSDFSLKRIIAAKLLIALIVELALTPVWLSFMYGKSYIVLMAERILKTFICFFVDVIIINFIVKKIYLLASNKH